HEIAILKMDVRVAHPAAAYPHDHFAAGRLGHLGNGLAQRACVGGERLANELRHVLEPLTRPIMSRHRVLPPARAPTQRSPRPARLPPAPWDRGLPRSATGADRPRAT